MGRRKPRGCGPTRRAKRTGRTSRTRRGADRFFRAQTRRGSRTKAPVRGPGFLGNRLHQCLDTYGRLFITSEQTDSARSRPAVLAHVVQGKGDYGFKFRTGRKRGCISLQTAWKRRAGRATLPSPGHTRRGPPPAHPSLSVSARRLPGPKYRGRSPALGTSVGGLTPTSSTGASRSAKQEGRASSFTAKARGTIVQGRR